MMRMVPAVPLFRPDRTTTRSLTEPAASLRRLPERVLAVPVGLARNRRVAFRTRAFAAGPSAVLRDS